MKDRSNINGGKQNGGKCVLEARTAELGWLWRAVREVLDLDN